MFKAEPLLLRAFGISCLPPNVAASLLTLLLCISVFLTNRINKEKLPFYLAVLCYC